jgi:wyosine [tRNA(Phe)-imidazoG37] synthetase (radical SAM superfamily)
MNERNIAFRAIFDMLNAASTDIFNRIIRAENAKAVNTLCDELEELRAYFNKCLVQIYKRFDSKQVKELDTNWNYMYKTST